MTPLTYRSVGVLLLLLPAFTFLIAASPLGDQSSKSFPPSSGKIKDTSKTPFNSKRSHSFGVDDTLSSPLTRAPSNILKRNQHRTLIPSSTTSLSSPAADPNPLTFRSFASTAYHYTNLTIIQPGAKSIKQIGQEVDSAVRRWMAYVDQIASYAPTQSYFTLSLGNLRLTFWSPAPIAWEVVTKILEAKLLILMVWYAVFRPVLWIYGTAAAVWLTLQFMDNGGNVGLALGRGFFPG